jgi:homoserine O-acetyltransferase
MTFCLRLFASLAICGAAIGADGTQQFAALGDFRLENGQVIRDCQIGYRTYGTLNSGKTNAILFPTWFSGTTKDLETFAGLENLIDTSRYYLITVDAIGDGVSTSASNSRSQPGMRFPLFSIRDMVESQHRMLTDVLNIGHLRAVVGISMGGMQTFAWATAYPEFLDKAVPIVGSPRQTSFDLLLWNTELHLIQDDREWQRGRYRVAPRLRALADLHNLALTTPQYRVRETNPKNFRTFLASIEKDDPHRFDANNWIRQLQAMIGHDVTAGFDGSLERAAEAIRAKFLIVAALQDHMVNPTPALELAKLLHAQVLELTGDCGHIAPGCEKDKMNAAVRKFLEE